MQVDHAPGDKPAHKPKHKARAEQQEAHFGDAWKTIRVCRRRHEHDAGAHKRQSCGASDGAHGYENTTAWPVFACAFMRIRR